MAISKYQICKGRIEMAAKVHICKLNYGREKCDKST